MPTTELFPAGNIFPARSYATHPAIKGWPGALTAWPRPSSNRNNLAGKRLMTSMDVCGSCVSMGIEAAVKDPVDVYDFSLFSWLIISSHVVIQEWEPTIDIH